MENVNIVPFTNLSKSCDLIVDQIYEEGKAGNITDEPIHQILPVGNSGGFRVKKNKYVVLYTTNEDLDWPDEINCQNGTFTYFGDQKQPGKQLHDTNNKGNLILKESFDLVHSRSLEDRKKFVRF